MLVRNAGCRPTRRRAPTNRIIAGTLSQTIKRTTENIHIHRGIASARCRSNLSIDSAGLVAQGGSDEHAQQCVARYPLPQRSLLDRKHRARAIHTHRLVIIRHVTQSSRSRGSQDYQNALATLHLNHQITSAGASGQVVRKQDSDRLPPFPAR